MQLIREDIAALYGELDETERALVDDRVLDPIYLVEPYMAVVLAQLTGGASDGEASFVAFQSTDDRRWSIGFAHFVESGVPYRLIAQFNLSYDGITAVTIERGYSEIDELYNGLNRFVRDHSDATESPYFDLSLSRGIQ